MLAPPPITYLKPAKACELPSGFATITRRSLSEVNYLTCRWCSFQPCGHWIIPLAYHCTSVVGHCEFLYTSGYVGNLPPVDIFHNTEHEVCQFFRRPHDVGVLHGFQCPLLFLSRRFKHPPHNCVLIHSDSILSSLCVLRT